MGRSVSFCAATPTIPCARAGAVLRECGPRDFRIVVVENEAGESSIDHELLAASQPKMLEGVLVLQNGCICCTATGSGMSDLERVIDQLLR